ncbi:hypothetical protein GCM10025734_39900 [Kitasatospora paranensis]
MSNPKPPAPAERQQPRRMPTPAELFGRRPKAKPQQSEPSPADSDDEEPELATGTG